MTENAPYTLWMMLSGHPYSARLYRLITAVDPKEFYHLTRQELIPLTGAKDAELFLNKDLNLARRILRECEEKGIGVCCYHDPDYPPALREIDDPPLILFHYGPLPLPDVPTMGIVGTRRCTRASALRTASFACSLALTGFQIISGMADGIDTYAHKGTLIKGLPSYAVLGCGVDVVYPQKNQVLYDLLKEHGALISEYLPGTTPQAGFFPRRNRIISGLSDGVLVMECPRKSGAMITARFAVEQNRQLFAVPASPDTDRYNGTNLLLKNGAIFCTDPEDVTKEFLPRFADRLTPVTVTFRSHGETEVPEPEEKPKKRKKRPVPEPERPAEPAPLPSSLSEEESVVCRALDNTEGLSAEEISEKTGIPFHQLLPLLQALELSGIIASVSGAVYHRI